MCFLLAFNNTTQFRKAFTWEKGEIKEFFKRVRDCPTKYNVEQKSQKTLVHVVDTIIQLIDEDENYLENSIEVNYQGVEFKHDTLFDLIGWLFSVTGTSPCGAKRSNYYYPLVALYSQFCLRACNRAPQIVQLTLFQQGTETRAALGANLDDPFPKKKKNAARKARVGVLVHAKLIDKCEGEMSYVKTVSSDTTSPSYGQKFGHCCETWPWLYINSLCFPPPVKRNAEGFAIKVTPGKFQYDEGAIIRFIANPCKNCEKLVERLGFTLQNFRRPR